MFHFVLGSGRENMLSDTDTACVAFALSLCFENGEEPPLDQSGAEEDQNTHMKIS
jgi:hypothetical protein